jgi:hypothetical protein
MVTHLTLFGFLFTLMRYVCSTNLCILDHLIFSMYIHTYYFNYCIKCNGSQNKNYQGCKCTIMFIVCICLFRELPVAEDAEPQEMERTRNLAIVEQLCTLTKRVLGQDFPHVKQSISDPEPRVEAAWVAGGMPPPANVRHALKSKKVPEEKANAPRNRYVYHFKYHYSEPELLWTCWITLDKSLEHLITIYIPIYIYI